jgi:ABC-2 type transport system permease protein
MKALDSSKFIPQDRVSLAQRLSVLGAMTRKELTILARYPVEFVSSFGRIFLIVAIFTLAGNMFSEGEAEAVSQAGSSLRAGLVIYGFVLFMFMSDTLWTIGYGVRQEQLLGTLEQLYLTPASKFASLVARVANTLVWNSLLTVAAAALMVAMIGRLPVENPLLGIYLLVMSLAGTFGLGFAFAALSLRLKETAQTVANFAQFALLILCANFFPFSTLPPFLLEISRWLPPAYCVDAFRSSLMGFPPGFPELAPFPVEFIIVTIFGLGMPVLGYALYRGSEIHARQQGSLSTY